MLYLHPRTNSFLYRPITYSRLSYDNDKIHLLAFLFRLFVKCFSKVSTIPPPPRNWLRSFSCSTFSRSKRTKRIGGMLRLSLYIVILNGLQKWRAKWKQVKQVKILSCSYNKRPLAWTRSKVFFDTHFWTHCVPLIVENIEANAACIFKVHDC